MTRWSLLLGASLLVLTGAAQSAEPLLMTPSGAVSPDGFDVFWDGATPLSCEGCDAKPLGKGGFFVTPKKNAIVVKLKAGGVSRSVHVGPPSASVALSLEIAPVKGRDREVPVRVHVVTQDAATEALPPVLRANVGEIKELTRISASDFRALYVLPKTKYPEVAVIVAFSAWPHPQSTFGAIGALRVPLQTFVEVPGTTEANADISFTIAGQSFGPVHANEQGRFSIPVVVPPGFGEAKSLTVDKLGNRKASTFNLHLPRTDQLACVVTPTRVPADGVTKARVLCATSDPFGQPALKARVKMTASKGRLGQMVDRGGGILEWSWTAPSETVEGTAALTATWTQGAIDSREELAIAVGLGPVTRVEPVAGDGIAHQNGSTVVELIPRNVIGATVPGTAIETRVAVGTTRVEERDGGSLALRYEPGADAGLGPTDIVARIYGPLGSEPARLYVFRLGATLNAAVTDLAGAPIPEQRVTLDGTKLITGRDGLVELPLVSQGVHVLKHDAWPLERPFVLTAENVLFPNVRPPGAIVTRIPMVVAPPAPVVVRISVETGAALIWVETPDGAMLNGRAIEVTARNNPPKQYTSEGKLRVVGAGVISAVDLQTGVSAIAQVPRE